MKSYLFFVKTYLTFYKQAIGSTTFSPGFTIFSLIYKYIYEHQENFPEQRMHIGLISNTKGL